MGLEQMSETVIEVNVRVQRKRTRGWRMPPNDYIWHTTMSVLWKFGQKVIQIKLCAFHVGKELHQNQKVAQVSLIRDITTIEGSEIMPIDEKDVQKPEQEEKSIILKTQEENWLGKILRTDRLDYLSFQGLGLDAFSVVFQTSGHFKSTIETVEAFMNVSSWDGGI